MEKEPSYGVHDVGPEDVPFEAYKKHWASLPTWPPHIAVAWVACPSWEGIVAQAKRQTGAPRMKEASEEVLNALIDDRLVAYGTRVGRRLDWIPPERITPVEWRELIWIGGTLSTAALNKNTFKKIFVNVQIDRIGLFRLWPDPDQRITSQVALCDRASADEILDLWSKEPGATNMTRAELLEVAQKRLAPKLVSDTKPFREAKRRFDGGRGTGKHGSRKK